MEKKRPDLILLDYEMPICDGKITLEMIRADKDMKDISVIFLTAVNDRDNYTVFVDQNEEESIIADVFVPREEE